MENVWMIWIAFGLVCLIIEIFTPGFFFMSIGVGAIITGLFSLLNISLPVQILIFIIVTFIIFLFMRKFSKKIMSDTSLETNIFALKGKTGIVTKDINPNERGYVKIGGEQWSAISSDNLQISVNTLIIVDSVEGNKLIVKKVKNKE